MTWQSTAQTPSTHTSRTTRPGSRPSRRRWNASGDERLRGYLWRGLGWAQKRPEPRQPEAASWCLLGALRRPLPVTCRHIKLRVRRPSGPPVYGWSLLLKKHSMRKTDVPIYRKCPRHKALREIGELAGDVGSVRFPRIGRASRAETRTTDPEKKVIPRAQAATPSGMVSRMSGSTTTVASSREGVRPRRSYRYASKSARTSGWRSANSTVACR